MAISEKPPMGSGYLVIEDDEEEDEQQQSKCFPCDEERHRYLQDLPFPQDRELVTFYTRMVLVGNFVTTERVHNPSHFIPVIDLPMSCNRYYALIGDGKYKGLVSTCSTRDNMGRACFCCKYIKDVKPKPLDYKNACQEVRIVDSRSSVNGKPIKGFFKAESVVADGFPQGFLRSQSWSIYRSKKHIYPLSEAAGVDEDVRARMPGKGFSGSSSSHVVVGQWYCPYIFVREDDMSPKDQYEKSMFYKMTLEQFWDEVYACERSLENENIVNVVTNVETERSSLHLHGEEVVEGGDVDGVWWFRLSKQERGGVGLDAVIVEKMKREEEEGGWVKGEGKVEIAQEFKGDVEEWRKFRCFVLVERFVLRRMDGTLVFTYDFKHIKKIMSNWE